MISNLFTPPAGQPTLAQLIGTAVDDALTLLVAETGRLIYPPPGLGCSCDAAMLPTAADARLVPNATGSYVLQIGFKRPGTGDIPALPSFAPSAIIDTQVLIGNSVLLQLLSCVVRRLPAFVLPVDLESGTIDVDNQPHLLCYTFTDATAIFGPLALEGGLSVCIDAAIEGPLKEFSLVGLFTMKVPNIIPTLSAAIPYMATIRVKFILPIAFDLNDVAAIADLRATGTSEVVDATVAPSFALLAAIGALLGVIFLIGGGFFSFLWAAAMIAACVALLIALGFVVSGAVKFLLTNAARTVLSGASLLRSPVAVPPGLFEAFGRFSPATVQVDDLASLGVLHTPTSPWALLPRLGLAGTRDPKGRSGSRKQPAAQRPRRPNVKRS
jgi:hypothetical protein